MSQSLFSARQIILIALFALSSMLSACGGGGGGSSATTTPVTPVTPTQPVGPIVSPMGCGTVTSTGSGNTTPLVIDGFPCAVAATTGVANSGAGYVNVPQQPYISVKICKPGSTTVCQIIDHVILDTGSSGMRMAASALSTSLQPGSTGLPLVAGTTPNTTLTECETYVDSYAYGPLVYVDVYIADEKALNKTMQVFGDANFPVPGACSNGAGTETNTVQSFNGNGLLGVSFNPVDNYTPYFDCGASTAASCVANYTYVGIPNIVTQFATNNNGVAITLPSIPATGATTPVSGSVTFGISTQTNNTPANSVLSLTNDGSALDVTYGTFSVEVGGTWTNAYIDSGTDVVYFVPGTTGLTACTTQSGNPTYWFCPTTTQSVTFNYANYTGAPPPASSTAVPYSVVNPSTISNNALAYSNLAGPASSSSTIPNEVALGLSTFFGHTNYVLFAGSHATSFGTGSNVVGPVNGIQ